MSLAFFAGAYVGCIARPNREEILLHKLIVGALGAIAIILSSTAFAQGTGTEARAMLDKAVVAVKADKAKTLDMVNM